jgi:hypothetical protein
MPIKLTPFQEKIYKMIVDSTFHKHFIVSLPRREGKTTLCKKILEHYHELSVKGGFYKKMTSTRE